MFKSLIQPLQLFLKGATGKDRHHSQQLTQQLMQLQVAYDGLQDERTSVEEDYSTLKAQHVQLQAKHSLLRRRHDDLIEDQQDWNALLNYADEEAKKLVSEKGKLRSQIKRLEAEKAGLIGRVAVLEHQLGLREYSEEAIANHKIAKDLASESLATKDEDSEDLATEATDLTLISEGSVDLSSVSLALVGGHETTHRGVREELKKYGLKRCIHVPPHSRESNSLHQIKDKISNCDLIVTITSYVDHSVSKCVKQLKANQVLAGDVILVHTHGKSSVVREVLDYFAA